MTLDDILKLVKQGQMAIELGKSFYDVAKAEIEAGRQRGEFTQEQSDALDARIAADRTDPNWQTDSQRGKAGA